jgi:hypothetical protein
MNEQVAQSAQGVDVKQPFWPRQFQPEATVPQTVTDLLFGVILPVLCFVFDPVVFRGNLIGRPVLGEIRFLAYTIAFIEIATLLVWLLRRKRLGANSVAVSGFLYVGALVSLFIGVGILPLTLIGIAFFGIGLLGLTPFVTAFIFLRNARRAFNLGAHRRVGARKLAAFMMGLIFVIGFPFAAHLKFSRDAQSALAKIIEGNVYEAEAATEQLRFINYFTETDTTEILRAYLREQDDARRERLARAYQKLTGKPLDANALYRLD